MNSCVFAIIEAGKCLTREFSLKCKPECKYYSLGSDDTVDREEVKHCYRALRSNYYK